MNSVAFDAKETVVPAPKDTVVESAISSRETAITATFKLIEVAFRLLFVLAILLLLEPKVAGQFGLLNTLVAIFSLCAGFERWGVVWRQLAGMGRSDCDALTAKTLRFFQFNHLLLAPAFIAAAYFWIRLNPYQIGLAVCIAICEQLAVGIYWLATVQGRYRWLIAITAGKNAAILLTAAFVAYLSSWTITLTLLLEIWAIAGLTSLLAFGRIYHGGDAAKLRFRLTVFDEVAAQYRESRAHFITGSAAFASGQIDRIVVGAAAGLALTGVYFKNVFLAASVYSAVTIILHNRAVPAIYRATAERRYRDALNTARRESLKAWVAYAAIVIVLLAVVQVPGVTEFLVRFSISPNHLAGLLLAFSLRTLADYNCTFLNAASREKWVLAIHTSMTALSMVMVLLLTKSFGIAGAVGGLIVGCASLLISSWIYRNKALVIAQTAAGEYQL